MGFNQRSLLALLLFSFGLAAAQWPRAAHSSSGSQPSSVVSPSLPVNTLLPSQWLQRDPQTRSPAVASLGLQLQTPSGAQGQQAVQQPVRQLTWRFPAAPRIPTPLPPVNLVRQSDPVPAQGITVNCKEDAVQVEVRRDVFGANVPLDVAALTLGGCAAKGLDASSQVVIFESALHDCNSKLTMTANELVYFFTLGAAAVPLSGTPIQRSAAAKVFIECHYPRLHNVSSSALVPAWIPYASAQAAEEQLVFTLRLMMDDWTSERSSNQYYLGELVNVEASVLPFNHVPLRVLIDHCVATAVPDVTAVPRYSFIENNGCLVDSKLTRSRSSFLPQSPASKLRFQLEAFRFQRTNSSLIYITCLLKATAASASADSENKACSFSDNRWSAAVGADPVCSCCDSSCSSRKGRDLSLKKGLQLEKEVSLGPIMVLENV